MLAANWDSMDVYEIVESSTQPDITLSTHRVRFAPTGGETVIEVSSNGGGPLMLDLVEVLVAGFSAARAPSAPACAPWTRGLRTCARGARCRSQG